MRIALFTLTLSIFWISSDAQPLTLSDCMRYAVEHNTGVKKQAFQNTIYKQDRMEATANLLPEIGATVNAYTNYGRSINPETNTYSNTANFNNSYSISASMRIFGGFSGINTMRAARMMQLMGVEQLQQVKDEVALKTMQAYFEVVYYTKSTEIAEEQLAVSRQTLIKTAKLGNLGLKSDADIAQVESQVASDDLLLTQEQNKLEVAILSLKDVMNYPLEDSLAINTAMEIPEDDINTVSGTLSSSALDNHPKMIAVGYKLRSTELQYSSFKGQLLPSLYIGGGYSTNYYENLNSGSSTIGFGTQFRENRGYYVNATLSIPIFNGLARTTNVNRYKSRMRIAEQETMETQRALKSEMAQTIMQMNGYAKEMLLATKKVEAADLAYRASLNKYDQGLVDAVELQTTGNQLIAAKSQRLNARLQYIIKYRLLEYYNGTPLISEQ